MKICIFGSGRNQISKSYIDMTEKVAYESAMRGHQLVFGGGGGGLMEAAARGMKKGIMQAGNLRDDDIIGVVPYDIGDSEGISENCTKLIHVETLEKRKLMFRELADVFLVFPGGIGTFDELFDLLALKRLEPAGEKISVKDKPVIICNFNGYYDDLLKLIETGISQGFIAAWNVELFSVCAEAGEILERLDEIQKRGERKFPEECCDASEIDDKAFEKWERGKSNGFWKEFGAPKKNE